MFNTSGLDELFQILNSIKGFKLRQPQWSNTAVTFLVCCVWNMQNLQCSLGGGVDGAGFL